MALSLFMRSKAYERSSSRGVRVGAGSGVGVGMGVGTGVGAGVGSDVVLGVRTGVNMVPGRVVGLAVGTGVGLLIGAGIGLAVKAGVGVAVGLGVETRVGLGVAVATATVRGAWRPQYVPPCHSCIMVNRIKPMIAITTMPNRTATLEFQGLPPEERGLFPGARGGTFPGRLRFGFLRLFLGARGGTPELRLNRTLDRRPSLQS